MSQVDIELQIVMFGVTVVGRRCAASGFGVPIRPASPRTMVAAAYRVRREKVRTARVTGAIVRRQVYP